MKREQFKGFKDMVAKADSKSDIWYAGYLWLDLTAYQTRQIAKVLAVHPDVQTTLSLKDGEARYRFPSGIEIKVPLYD